MRLAKRAMKILKQLSRIREGNCWSLTLNAGGIAGMMVGRVRDTRI